jgi:hypothetical protein
MRLASGMREVIAFQNAGLLPNARKVRDRLFVDDRRLGDWRLPDFCQGCGRSSRVNLAADRGC